MGSLLNQYIAYHHPDRVQALVHVGGFPLHNGFSERTIKLMQIHVKMLQLMPSKAIYNTFGQLVAQNPDAQAYAREASQRTGKKNIVSLEREFLMDLQEGIPEHPEQPQLILMGNHEYSLLRKKAEMWNRAHPNSRYKTIPDAGHLANHDNPTAFNELLYSYLEII